MIKLARAAADQAPATHLGMVRNCVNVAAFAVRGVAYICACEIGLSESGCQPLSVVIRHFAKLTRLSQTLELPSMMNDAADLARSFNDIVIRQTERVLYEYDSKRPPAKKPKGGRLRSRRYLHRVSRNQKRTLKKKNISRKYSKYSRSGCDGIRTRSLRRRRRRSYSRKIGKYNK